MLVDFIVALTVPVGIGCASILAGNRPGFKSDFSVFSIRVEVESKIAFDGRFTPILAFPHQGGRNNTFHLNTCKRYRFFLSAVRPIPAMADRGMFKLRMNGWGATTVGATAGRPYEERIEVGRINHRLNPSILLAGREVRGLQVAFRVAVVAGRMLPHRGFV